MDNWGQRAHTHTHTLRVHKGTHTKDMCQVEQEMQVVRCGSEHLLWTFYALLMIPFHSFSTTPLSNIYLLYSIANICIVQVHASFIWRPIRHRCCCFCCWCLFLFFIWFWFDVCSILIRIINQSVWHLPKTIKKREEKREK